MTTTRTEIACLPGGDVIAEGVEAFEAGRETVASLLVEIAATRLRHAGLDLSRAPTPTGDAELRLYDRLCREATGDAYSRYNALLRRLTRFARALEAEHFRAARQARQRLDISES